MTKNKRSAQKFDLHNQIDAMMHELVKPDGPGAAIGVVKEGAVIHRQGYGLANLEWQIPIQPNTVFRLASLTKQFTAVAIMLLQTQGKVNIADPITKFLPTYPTSGHDITVHHLLTHTSGIKSYTDIEGWFPNRIVHDMKPQELCNVFSQIPFDFKPGSRFLYNNSGYHLLGMIIEAASGMSYAQFIQEQIFQPLAMHHSYYMSNETIIAQRANGYTPVEQDFHNASYLSMTQPYAAGSLGSTVEDLILWENALRQERLLPHATLEEMFTPVTLTNGVSEDYGYGWAITNYRGHHLTHHGGGINGFSTFLAHFCDEPVSIIVLTNREGFDAGNCALKIACLVLDLPTIERVPVTISEAALDRLVGKYLINDEWPLEVQKADNHLVIKRDQGEKSLWPLAETRFYVAGDEEEEVTFSDEQAGHFTKMTLVAPLYSLVAKWVPDEPPKVTYYEHDHHHNRPNL